MQKYTLHESDSHSWVVVGRDPNRLDSVIDTNEYIITSGDEAILLDPGGVEIFPQALTAVSTIIDIRKIKAYFCSHQDPDIMSSLALWLTLTPDAKIYLPWLWSGFVAHFGGEFVKNFHLLPDEGGSVELGGKTFQFIPAHHCHSAGNFHFFDPEARILFSGDIGAALLPREQSDIFVQDFTKHVTYMEKFHRRWMPSQDALRIWVERVRKLKPRMICPQHGAIFMNENVKNLLDWLEDLEVGRLKKSA
jgi:flavorubredoxin